LNKINLKQKYSYASSADTLSTLTFAPLINGYHLWGGKWDSERLAP